MDVVNVTADAFNQKDRAFTLSDIIQVDSKFFLKVDNFELVMDTLKTG